MAKKRSVKMIGWGIAVPVLLSLACLIGGGAATALPPQRPADFEVQTATPTINARLATVDLEATELDVVSSMVDAPTHTPDPNAVPTQPPPPTATLVPLAEPTLALTPTSIITATSPLTEAVVAAPPPRPAVTPDPPLQGGDWDFESDFIPWPNPFGEPCPGARVASGWTAFVEQGEYGSSCMNENLYQPNVFSGLKSQEITFDFIAANSGVFRTIPVKVGHRYNIMAFGKHDHSLAVVELFLGIDLTGGTVWNAETVQWFPWDSGAEDAWLPTEETVTAAGEAMTIFVRGVHPLAEQGGKTVIDNVSVTDLGP